MTHKEGEVALIATTDPPLARLRDILVNRLARRDRDPDFCESGYVYRKQVSTEHPLQDYPSRVASILERVRLSRAFDFPGVAEAIGEFGARLEEHDIKDKTTCGGGQHQRARNIADNEDELEGNLSSRMDESAYEDPAVSVGAAERFPAAMIVIDQIANVVGSMMTKSQLQGNLQTPLEK